MRKLALASVLACLPFVAHAQGGPPTQHIAPEGFGGQGIFSVPAASTTLAAAGVTLSPGSQAFPAANQPLPARDLVSVANQGSQNAGICWHGGTCTIVNSYLLLPGASRTVELPDFRATPPTMICASGTCPIEVEW
jgi:hypothetical protein